jgi:hypothetical protein
MFARRAVEGPFFPEWEFPIIFGLERDEVKSVFDSWPNVDESDEEVSRAINNSMLNLISYPAPCKAHEWPKFISTTGPGVWRIFLKWKGSKTRDYKARDLVDESM